MPFTVVFEGDVAAFDDNPLDFESDFGKVAALSKGDALAEIERLRTALEDAEQSIDLFVNDCLSIKSAMHTLDHIRESLHQQTGAQKP